MVKIIRIGSCAKLSISDREPKKYCRLAKIKGMTECL